jgi:hypothetical protein
MDYDEGDWSAERDALIADFEAKMALPGADVKGLRRQRGRERAFLTMGLAGTRAAAAKGRETRESA